MKKQKSVVAKLALITISLFIVLFAIFNVISTSILHTESKTTGEELITLATNKTASEIGAYLNPAIATLEADNHLILSLIEREQLISSTLIDYKKRALEKDPNVLGYSIILKASELANILPEHTQYIDQDGYFAIYVVNSNGQIIIEPVPDSTKSDWYTEAAATKKLAITEPYEYAIDGVATSMITISFPLLKNSEVIGMTIVDFPLDFLDDIIALNSPATSVQRVASATGILISDSGNPDNVNESLKSFVPNWEEVFTAVQAGQNINFYADSITFGEEAYAVLAPVEIKNYDRHFIVETFIPKSTVLAMYNRILGISIIAAIAIALILAGATYFFIYRALKPLQQVQRALTTASTGELTIHVEEKSLANDEIGAVGQAYNTMRHQVANVIQHVAEQANTLENTSQSANRGIEEISQSSQDMTKAINDIATGAQSQASEIDAANRELAHLDSKIDEISTMATQMLNNVEQSNVQAQKGRTELHKLHIQSEHTSQGNEELELQMEMLAKQISQINAVMHSIQGITEQTNLLALNASIEAARAGEYGKGFAVVADEVRKLAEQSKRETDHVQTIVSNILHESEQTKQLTARNSSIFKEQMLAVTSTEQAFTTQLMHAEQMESHIKALLHELEQMMQEKELVITSMQSIAAISEQSAASAEEISASSEEQYNEMLKIVTLMNELADISTALKQKTAFFHVS
ncbi:MAG: methyl-accepting chemotaxis protein [Solibacillus sp.]